ncbi:hypothetical protein P4O66_009730, partial [Electrophorus voltai]
MLQPIGPVGERLLPNAPRSAGGTKCSSQFMNTAHHRGEASWVETICAVLEHGRALS